MAGTDTDAGRTRTPERLTTQTVTTWLYVVLTSVFIANALILLTAPNRVMVVEEPGGPRRMNPLEWARSDAAETGGTIGLVLAVLTLVCVWWVRWRGTAHAWRLLRGFVGLVAGSLALALVAQLFLGRHVREREPWLTFQTLIPTSALFVIMWIQIWIAVRRCVWREDPEKLERVFE